LANWKTVERRSTGCDADFTTIPLHHLSGLDGIDR
jgi:hypothetical protein